MGAGEQEFLDHFSFSPSPFSAFHAEKMEYVK